MHDPFLVDRIDCLEELVEIVPALVVCEVPAVVSEGFLANIVKNLKIEFLTFFGLLPARESCVVRAGSSEGA